MALAWLAPGFLTHYLALVYAGLLGLHLLSTSWRNLPVQALVRAGVVWAVLIGPWFGYMMLNFGVRRTLLVNTTVAARDAQGRRFPLPRVLITNLCADLLPGALCRPLLPSSLREPPRLPRAEAASGPCLKVAVQASEVTYMPVPCEPDFPLNGFEQALNGTAIYRLLGYSGLLAVVLAAGLPAGSLFGRFGGEARFLLWFFAGGLVLNVLTYRDFETGGNFSNSLQAWCVLLFTVLARRLARLPRWALALLAMAMILEFGSSNWQDIRGQTTVLPLANERRAGVGDPPLGTLLPAPQSDARFVTDSDYYRNYVIKIQGGAPYYRDIHPQGVASACCVLLVIGALMGTAAFLFMSEVKASKVSTFSQIAD